MEKDDGLVEVLTVRIYGETTYAPLSEVDILMDADIDPDLPDVAQQLLKTRDLGPQAICTAIDTKICELTQKPVGQEITQEDARTALATRDPILGSMIAIAGGLGILAHPAPHILVFRT